MKKNLLLFIAVSLAVSVFAQAPKKKPAAPASAPALKNMTDSLSYAIGLSVANFYKEQGFSNINTTVVARAINDALKNGKLQMTEQQGNNLLVNYVQKARSDAASATRKAG